MNISNKESVHVSGKKRIELAASDELVGQDACWFDINISTKQERKQQYGK
ncbi:hypothetical protein [Aminipila terrae]|uniref:Uncharacterized protein n=1 Tax=Aminipila terrae TaxID=2697030 RepID=A0A6P1MMW6_9FIRM|nr:hypothetical protein [Aminipila terrae]QHI72355.1 hypothetical protein Ami3637_08015 [Aminipila terrae]